MGVVRLTCATAAIAVLFQFRDVSVTSFTLFPSSATTKDSQHRGSVPLQAPTALSKKDLALGKTDLLTYMNHNCYRKRTKPSSDSCLSLFSSRSSTSSSTINKRDALEVDDIGNGPFVQSVLPKTSNTGAVTQSTSGPNEEEYQRGLKTIAFITLLFSSYSPVLHGAFSSVTTPPPALLMNAAVSTVALSGLFVSGPLLNSSTPLPCTLEEKSSSSQNDKPDFLSLKAGAELGLWKMLGTTSNIYGLSLTTAGHGAFLIQLTTLIVPLIQFIAGVPIPKRIWTAIAMALSGVFLFTHDPTSVAASGDSLVSDKALLGDGLCVLAAIFYATYDLRLFDWGKQIPPLKLMVNKVSTQAILSVALLLTVGFGEAKDYFLNLASSSEGLINNDTILIGFAAIWSGLLVNAVAPFLQVGAQQAVGPTRAQVVYASQPLWAAILSYMLLGETVGLGGFIGGGVFLGAMFLAATAEAPNPNCEQDICEV